MRAVKRTIKAVMSKKGVKTGQLADILNAEANQTAVWLAREDGKSIEKILEVANALGCTMAFVDKETGAIYNVG